MRFKYVLLQLLVSYVSLSAAAQSPTTGMGELVSIETKAKSYDANSEKILQYKQELPALEALWKAKLQKLKKELADLYTERDKIIADMKVGARCSECKRWKTQLEKEGINFEKHLGEVKGYAIPATTAELEAVRKSYAEKIAYKKVQIQNLENGDKEVIAKQNAIKQLEETNARLCKEITAHSKNYEIKVLSDAKARHVSWINDLMSHAIFILQTDDIITICKARILRYEQEFQKESELIKERVRKENVELRNKINIRIVTLQEQLNHLKIERANYTAPLESDLSELISEKNETENELRSLSLPDSMNAELMLSLNQLTAQISYLKKHILDFKIHMDRKISLLEKELTELRDEVFSLSAILPKQQEQEVSKIRPRYDQWKLEISQRLTKESAELIRARKLYSERAEYYRKQNLLYVDHVIHESNRMTSAGNRISCPVWNEVRFQVMGNWNKEFPCVSSLTTMAKPYSHHVFNSYCPSKTASTYMAKYKTFLLNLNEDDKDAVRRNSNVGWFEFITK